MPLGKSYPATTDDGPLTTNPSPTCRAKPEKRSLIRNPLLAEVPKVDR